MIYQELQNTGLIVATANVRKGSKYIRAEQYIFCVKTRRAGELYLAQLEVVQNGECPKLVTIGYDAALIVVKPNMKAMHGTHPNLEDPIYNYEDTGNFELLDIRMDHSLDGLGLVRYSKDMAHKYALPVEHAYDYGISPEYKTMLRETYLKLQREKHEMAIIKKTKIKRK